MKLFVKLGVLAMLVSTLPFLTTAKKASAVSLPPNCYTFCYDAYEGGLASCGREYAGNPSAEAQCDANVDKYYAECASNCGKS